MTIAAWQNSANGLYCGPHQSTEAKHEFKFLEGLCNTMSAAVTRPAAIRARRATGCRLFQECVACENHLDKFP